MGKRILDIAKKFAKAAPKTAISVKSYPNLQKGKGAVSRAKSCTKQKQRMKQYHDKMRKQMQNFYRELRKSMVVVTGSYKAWCGFTEAEKRDLAHKEWRMAGEPRPGTEKAEFWKAKFIVTHQLKLTYDKVLKQQLEYFDENRAIKGFDPKKRREGGGRKQEMSDKDSGLNAALRIKGSGGGIATRAVNVKRTIEGKKIVSESTVRRNFRSSFEGEVHNQQSKKTGKKDPGSDWAIGRFGLCRELKARGIDPKKMSLNKRGIPVRRIRPNFRAMYLDAGKAELKIPVRKVNTMEGILFVDQKHAKVVFGDGSGKKQCRCYVDPNDHSKPMRKADGGELVPYDDRLKAKFPQEFRGAFGFTTKWVNGLGYRGFVMEPYEYTGKRMLGPKKFAAMVNAEISRVKKLVSYTKNQKGEGKWGCDHAENPYLAKYGEGWMAQMKQKLGRGSNAVVSVTDMVDHIKEQGDKLYKDTDFEGKWILWHDALAQLWCPDGWAYIEKIGMGDRVIRCHSKKGGEFYAGDRYYQKLPGDGPELMPCDANLFSDLVNLARWNVALTSHLPTRVDDGNGNQILNEKKFSMGTPKQLSRLYRATIGTNGLGGALTFPQDRIVTDIFRIPFTVSAIIGEEGARVDFCGKRIGRRSTEHEPGVRSKRKRSKKSELTLDQLSLHPYAREALDVLIAEYGEADTTDRYTNQVTSEAEEGDGGLLEPDDSHLDEDEDEDNYEDERALAELDDEEGELEFEDDA